MKREIVNKYLIRLLIVSLIALAVVLIFNEIAFLLQRDRSLNRPPTTVTLVIPAGAAANIAVGQAPSTLPSEMTFVLGDVLEVKNEDSVTHQLGPLYIPPGTTAALPLNTADHYKLGCSFQTGNYFGLDVRQPTTLGTRLFAMFTAGPATALFLYLNSLLFFPIKAETKKKDPNDGSQH